MNIHQPNGNIKVEDHSLGDFLNSVQELVLQGYKVDLTSNENYPYCYVGYYSCGMVKVGTDAPENTAPKAETVQPEVFADTADLIIDLVTDDTEVKPEVKRGRKPKGD